MKAMRKRVLSFLGPLSEGALKGRKQVENNVPFIWCAAKEPPAITSPKPE
jgi:hypothetical protein